MPTSGPALCADDGARGGDGHRPGAASRIGINLIDKLTATNTRWAAATVGSHSSGALQFSRADRSPCGDRFQRWRRRAHARTVQNNMSQTVRSPTSSSTTAGPGGDRRNGPGRARRLAAARRTGWCLERSWRGASGHQPGCTGSASAITEWVKGHLHGTDRRRRPSTTCGTRRERLGETGIRPRPPSGHRLGCRARDRRRNGLPPERAPGGIRQVGTAAAVATIGAGATVAQEPPLPRNRPKPPRRLPPRRPADCCCAGSAVPARHGRHAGPTSLSTDSDEAVTGCGVTLIHVAQQLAQVATLLRRAHGDNVTGLANAVRPERVQVGLVLGGRIDVDDQLDVDDVNTAAATSR